MAMIKKCGYHHVEFHDVVDEFYHGTASNQTRSCGEFPLQGGVLQP